MKSSGLTPKEELIDEANGAVGKGDFATIKKLAQGGFDINQELFWNSRLIDHGAAGGRFEFVKRIHEELGATLDQKVLTIALANASKLGAQQVAKYYISKIPGPYKFADYEVYQAIILDREKFADFIHAQGGVVVYEAELAEASSSIDNNINALGVVDEISGLSSS
jgi:hypothetical protein